MSDHQRYYSIGEVSKISGLSQKTLRYYQQLGLVSPGYIDPDSSYRYYTREQFFRIYIVKRFQSYGFSLQEIKDLFEQDDVEAYREAVREKIAGIREQMKQLEKTLRDADLFIDRLALLKSTSDNSMPDNIKEEVLMGGEAIKLEELPVRQVLFKNQRRHNYTYNAISVEYWLELYNQAKEENLTVSGPIIFCYHTDAPLEQFFDPNCQIEVMLPIEDADTDRDDVRDFGGFLAATIYHIGPYSTASTSHLELLRWIKENNLILSGPICEECLVNPFDLDFQSDYVTKVIAPVRRQFTANG